MPCLCVTPSWVTATTDTTGQSSLQLRRSGSNRMPRLRATSIMVRVGQGHAQFQKLSGEVEIAL